MAGSKIGKIVFIDDDGSEIGELLPMPVQKMLDAIYKIPRGKLVSRLAIVKQAGYNTLKSGYTGHEKLKPYLLVTKAITNKKKAFCGHPDDIAAKKKEFDEAGIEYS